MYKFGSLSCFLEYIVTQPENLDLGLWTKDLSTGEEAFRFVEMLSVESTRIAVSFPSEMELADRKYMIKPRRLPPLYHIPCPHRGIDTRFLGRSIIFRRLYHILLEPLALNVE